MNQIAQLREFNRQISNPATVDYVRTIVGADKANVFLTSLVGVASKMPSLLNCDPMSVMYAALKSVALDLPIDPSLGYAYVIPYGRDAQFQLGYKGLYQLAIRSGQYRYVNVCEVKEGEISQNLMTGDIDLHPAHNRQQLPTIGYCAFFELKNGFCKSLFMTVDETKAHGIKYSKMYHSENGQWQKNFEAMAKKTVLKLLLSKWAPTSVTLQTAIQVDSMVFNNSGAGEYSDNPQSKVTEAEAVEVVESNINQKLDND